MSPGCSALDRGDVDSVRLLPPFAHHLAGRDRREEIAPDIGVDTVLYVTLTSVSNMARNTGFGRRVVDEGCRGGRARSAMCAEGGSDVFRVCFRHGKPGRRSDLPPQPVDDRRRSSLATGYDHIRPCSASRLAIASPMPRLAPVLKQSFHSRSNGFVLVADSSLVGCVDQGRGGLRRQMAYHRRPDRPWRSIHCRRGAASDSLGDCPPGGKAECQVEVPVRNRRDTAQLAVATDEMVPSSGTPVLAILPSRPECVRPRAGVGTCRNRRDRPALGCPVSTCPVENRDDFRVDRSEDQLSIGSPMHQRRGPSSCGQLAGSHSIRVSIASRRPVSEARYCLVYAGLPFEIVPSAPVVRRARPHRRRQLAASRQRFHDRRIDRRPRPLSRFQRGKGPRRSASRRVHDA